MGLTMFITCAFLETVFTNEIRFSCNFKMTTRTTSVCLQLIIAPFIAAWTLAPTQIPGNSEDKFLLLHEQEAC